MNKYRVGLSLICLLVILLAATQIRWVDRPEEIQDVNHYIGEALVTDCRYSSYKHRSNYTIKISSQIISFKVPFHECFDFPGDSRKIFFEGYFVGAAPIFIKINSKIVLKFSKGIGSINTLFYMLIGIAVAAFIYVQLVFSGKIPFR